MWQRSDGTLLWLRSEITVRLELPAACECEAKLKAEKEQKALALQFRIFDNRRVRPAELYKLLFFSQPNWHVFDQSGVAALALVIISPLKAALNSG